MFARQDCEIGARGSGVDIWTARVSDFDLDIPAHAALVVVWDDLFSPDTLAAEIEDTRQSLADTFGLDRPDETAFAVVLPGCGSVGTALECAMGTPAGPGRRIAVIDVGSTGVTDLSWNDILPVIRAHYDLMIGIAHVPLAGPRTWSNWLADNDMGDDLLQMERDQFTQCDVVVLTSDGLLGLGEDFDSGLRRTHVRLVMSNLIESLVDPRVTLVLAAKRGERVAAPRHFALCSVTTAAEESIKARRRLIDEEFGAPCSERPILDGPCRAVPSLSMALWSFEPNGYLRRAHIGGSRETIQFQNDLS
jgi:hypothetical protein